MGRDTPNKHLPSATAIDLGQFARRAAHDVANPLNAMSMATELAIQLIARNQVGAAREHLELVAQDCKRVARLVRDMGKFGSDLQTGPGKRIKLRDVIDDAIATAIMEGVQIPAALDSEVGNVTVFADSAALQRIVVELFRNATEAGATSIKIREEQNTDMHVITFCDNGSGIAEHVRERVFDAFFTTRHAAGNSGLGLTLIHALILAHGGNVVIEPRNSSGACITLHLPETEPEHQI